MSVSQTLRAALVESNEPLLRIETVTEVPRGSIRRFIRGEQSLRSDLIDKLATHFGLTLVKKEEAE